MYYFLPKKTVMLYYKKKASLSHTKKIFLSLPDTRINSKLHTILSRLVIKKFENSFIIIIYENSGFVKAT